MKTCSTCGKSIHHGNQSGFCVPCWAKQPGIRERRRELMTARWQNDPDFRRAASRCSDIPEELRVEYDKLTRNKRLDPVEAREALGLPRRVK